MSAACAHVCMCVHVCTCVYMCVHVSTCACVRVRVGKREIPALLAWTRAGVQSKDCTPVQQSKARSPCAWGPCGVTPRLAAHPATKLTHVEPHLGSLLTCPHPCSPPT